MSRVYGVRIGSREEVPEDAKRCETTVFHAGGRRFVVSIPAIKKSSYAVRVVEVGPEFWIDEEDRLAAYRGEKREWFEYYFESKSDHEGSIFFVIKTVGDFEKAHKNAARIYSVMRELRSGYDYGVWLALVDEEGDAYVVSSERLSSVTSYEDLWTPNDGFYRGRIFIVKGATGEVVYSFMWGINIRNLIVMSYEQGRGRISDFIAEKTGSML